MWQSYYDEIYSQLFLPFIFYFLSFIAYTTYFGQLDSHDVDFTFFLKIVCLVVFGKTYVTFVILEVINF